MSDGGISAGGIEHDDLPRVECSCGWSWDVIDAIEDGELWAHRVKSRFSSMREGHAYFNREPGHDLEYVDRDDVTDELVRLLRSDGDQDDW